MNLRRVRSRLSCPGFTKRRRIRVAWSALIAGIGLLAADVGRAQQVEAPIPRGSASPVTIDRSAVDALKERALERANAERAAVDPLREAAATHTRSLLEQATGRRNSNASERPQARFVYFTSRTCVHCDESLDALVKRFIEAHPDVSPEVVYLGNPLIEYPQASAVFVTFADDVIARWRDRLKDPAVLEALKKAGKVKDSTGRVAVSFATKDAEARGITEVPAFLVAVNGRECLAIGRPAGVDALETLWAAAAGGASP